MRALLVGGVALTVAVSVVGVPTSSVASVSWVSSRRDVTAPQVGSPGLRASTAHAPVPRRPTHHRLPSRYTGRVFAIGDSVMLGARKCLPQHGVTADPKGNRQPYQGAAILSAMRTRLPHVVIVHLGTNAGIDDGEIDTIMRIIGPSRTVVWVTLQLRNDYTRYLYEDSSNLAIRDVLLRYPNVRVADWNLYTETHRGLVGGDGIHLTNDGCTAYANLLDSVARAA